MLFFGILIPLLFLQLSSAIEKTDQKDDASSVLPGQVEATQSPSAKVEATQTTPAKVEETQATSAKVEATQTTPAKVEETQATSAKVEEKSVAALLGDKHKDAGVACADCHKETPPASEVPTSVCMTCHEDYNTVAASSVDPHSAHVEFTNCGDCHHSHKASENQCLACHTFDLQVP